MNAQDDKSGEVSTEKLRSICKEFSLTLDIDKFIGMPIPSPPIHLNHIWKSSVPFVTF